MSKSLHVRAHVFKCFIFIFLSSCICVRVCVREGEAETLTGTQMHPDCDMASHSHDLQFLLDYQQMESKGEYAAARLIADRSDLRPLHHPRSWLHGATSLPSFMMLCVWPRNKHAAACSVIRQYWNQLLTLTIQHGAVLLVLFKCDACKIKYFGEKKMILHVSCIDSSCSYPLPDIPLCYWSNVKTTDNSASWSDGETVKKQMLMAGLRQHFSGDRSPLQIWFVPFYSQTLD